MSSNAISLIFSCLAVLIFAGCASTPVRVDPGSGRSVTTVAGINMQDWYDASDTMINSLRDNFINTGRFVATAEKPALLVISRLVNNTGTHLDSDLLVKKIRIALLQASQGRLVTSTTISLGEAEDPIAQEELRRARLLGIEPSRPDYTLSGKIIEQRARSGSVREASYVFQLSVTKNPEGYAIWEEERTITKQGKRSTVTVW